MTSRLRLFACALTLMVATAAVAETPPPAKPWSDITEVVVRAHVAGPAMWKLTSGASTVWVMGALHVAPRDIAWDSARFRRVLDGAHFLILPRIIDDWTVSAQQMQLPGSEQFSDVVSAATYKRYQAVVDGEKLDDLPTSLAFKPAWAGSWLIVHVYQAHGFTTHMVPPDVESFAKQSGVIVKYVDRHTAWLQERQYDRLDAPASEACLNDYLDSIDHDLTTVDEMGKAWAQGDVSTILAHHRDPAWVTCFLSQPKYGQIYQTYAVDDMVKALDSALKAPGKGVAVMPLSDLLRRDGILDRLRAEGVTITAPAE